LTALADSPDTAFWNPAGMTRLPKSRELQLVTAYSSSEFAVEEATHTGGDPHKLDETNFIPGLYYVNPLNIANATNCIQLESENIAQGATEE
jgi:long-subunit fatty acid transport protein